MPGWPESEAPSLQQSNSQKSLIPLHGHSLPPHTSPNVSISWGLGNRLRISYLHSKEQDAPPSSSLPACKIVEVKVGSNENDGDDDVTSSANRRLLYDSIAPFALLQSRRKQVLLQSGGSLPLPSDWWESVLEYSRSISAVLGSEIKPSEKGTKEIETRSTLVKAIWDLLEIVFVDKHASSWITEQLFSWLESYDRVLSRVEPTIQFKLASCQNKFLNMEFPEDDADYWDCIASALSVGWLDIVVKCLRMHGSYQHNQIDDRQTENGLVEAVAVLISKMPRLRPSTTDEKLGMTYSFKPEFSKAWDKWRNQIIKLNRSSFWSDCTHQGTLAGLKKLLLVLLGDVDTLSAATTHWMELLVSHFLFIRPFLVVSEGILGLARKCVQLKAPVENDFLFELLLGILGENTQVVLIECRKLFDPWMMTHIVELLSARNIQAQDFLLGEREELDGISLEEHHRLVYAQLLSSHPCTWQLAPLYLAACPRKGQAFLEKLLLMQPISDHTQAHLKVLDICRMYELRHVSEKYMQTIGVHYWKQGRKGMGISWLQRARDYGRLSAAANELLTLVSQRNVGELEGLIDLLGPQFEGFGGLGFLHRFRDFKVSFYNFQDSKVKIASVDVQNTTGKEAARRLMLLMRGSVTPQKFVLPLLQDAVELLEFNGEVLLNAAETNLLLFKLQNLFICTGNDELDSLDKSSKSVQSIRLALACNLGRSILKE